MKAARPKSGPFLKWAGGKSQLLADLLELSPSKFRRYHEPFLGGGALFFALSEHGRVTQAFLSDLNQDLMTTYRAVRNCPKRLIDALSALENEYSSADSRSDFYYSARDEDPSGLVSVAARLMFLNKTCYNGLYRVNRAGKFNVPFGRYKKPAICNPLLIRSASKALRTAQLTRVPFEEALQLARRNDFVYLDPPYEPLSKTASFTGYTAGGFDFADQERLADEVARLTSIGAKVMLSNSNIETIEHLYRRDGYDIKEVQARRAINSNGSRRGTLRELIVRNYS